MNTLQKKLFLVVITAALGAFAFVAPAFALVGGGACGGCSTNHNETFLWDAD